MATKTSPPRADTPNDFYEDVHGEVREAITDEPDSQVVILVTPIPAPPTDPETSELSTDANNPEAAAAAAAPRIELRHLRIPKTALYDMIPSRLWYSSPVTSTLGVPLKLARYMGSVENKTPNPSLIGFSMSCDFSDLAEFGKVSWTKVQGAVMVARVDGGPMEVAEFAALVQYANLLGRELRAMKEEVEEEMKGWDAEMRIRAKEARERGEVGTVQVEKEVRRGVREGKRVQRIRGWAGERVSVEAFGRFREEVEKGEDGGQEVENGKEREGGEGEKEVEDERVDEVIQGMERTSIAA